MNISPVDIIQFQLPFSISKNNMINWIRVAKRYPLSSPDLFEELEFGFNHFEALVEHKLERFIDLVLPIQLCQRSGYECNMIIPKVMHYVPWTLPRLGFNVHQYSKKAKLKIIDHIIANQMHLISAPIFITNKSTSFIRKLLKKNRWMIVKNSKIFQFWLKNNPDFHIFYVIQKAWKRENLSNHTALEVFKEKLTKLPYSTKIINSLFRWADKRSSAKDLQRLVKFSSCAFIKMELCLNALEINQEHFKPTVIEVVNGIGAESICPMHMENLFFYFTKVEIEGHFPTFIPEFTNAENSKLLPDLLSGHQLESMHHQWESIYEPNVTARQIGELFAEGRPFIFTFNEGIDFNQLPELLNGLFQSFGNILNS